MNILHLTLDQTIAQDGKETVFYNMLKHFSRYWGRIDVLCPGSAISKKRTIYKNIHVHPSPWSFWFQIPFIVIEGSKLLATNRYSAILVQSCPPFFLDIAALYLRLRFRIPVILEVMHVVGYPKATGIWERIGPALTKFWLRLVSSNLVAIRVINKETYALLLAWDIPKTKILLVPAFYLDSNLFQKIKGIKKEKNSILFIGRLVANKGVFELLKAITKIKEKIPDVTLTVIGEGPLRPKIKLFIEQNGLHSAVKFVGFLKTQEELVRFYNQSEVLAVVSYNEGGPRVVLEAMACGLPVVSTNVGIVGDVIKDGENGLLTSWDPIDIAQKLTLLLKDNKLRYTFSSRNLDTIKQFEARKMIQNYAQAYKKLLQNHEAH